jgi:hypothetical protein
MESLAGFPYWTLEFDEDGGPVDPAAADRCLAEVAAGPLSDLFVFSHGWNNDRRRARQLYEEFFTEMRGVIQARGTAQGATPGVAGIIWPSILFPDDEPETTSGGAVGLDDRPAADLAGELKKVFRKQPGGTVEELVRLLDQQPSEPAALTRFHELLKTLTTEAREPEDNGEAALLRNPAAKVFEVMADLAPEERSAAAGVSDAAAKLWRGAKEALRAATYWTMKQRAGVVGERGLGPLLGRLRQARAALRVHLVGHSFGCRVVSFALKGLPAGMEGGASPVKSVFLLQGAFSHYAFADSLPHAPGRAGALKGMAARVDGPLVVTHSQHDLAVCKRYPQASFISRDDAADFDDAVSRWGAMGSRGAQAVHAGVDAFKPVGQAYAFASGRFLNLDGDHLITRGGPPSGAHSDIIYPEIAWAVLQAARLTR